MKCKNCGTENKGESKFCKKCGASLEDAPKASSRFSPLKIIGIIIAVLVVLMGSVSTYVIYNDVSATEVMQLSGDSAGDVLKNSQIASNVPDSLVSTQITEAAKNGVPIYKIGDGSAPVSVITAGVHGDQLVPCAAAMKLIDYLDGRKINGTVYVIPFVSPEAISNNTKLTDGVNLNTVADENGTLSNKIVNLAKNSNATAVGDFHETEPGKNPGVTTIMCSQVPTYESYQLANAMSMLSLDTTLTYTVAGVSYDGAIEDTCNLNGVPAVTPLVLVSSHGKVSDAAVTESYTQMLALLLANHNLNPDDLYLKIANIDKDGFK